MGSDFLSCGSSFLISWLPFLFLFFLDVGRARAARDDTRETGQAEGRVKVTAEPLLLAEAVGAHEALHGLYSPKGFTFF